MKGRKAAFIPARKKFRAELELSGSAAHEPGKYGSRFNAESSGELGAPPDHLTTAQRRIWREIAKAAPEGTLTNSDAIMVESAVRLVEKMRAGQLNRPAELSVLHSALAKLGLNPTDRSRLNIVPAPKPRPDDPWEQFSEHFVK